MLILCNLVYGQEGKEDGVHKSYHNNGNVAWETTIKDGLIVSIKKYYDSGKIKMESYHKNEILDGVYRDYFESGIIQREVYYKEGILLDENGKPKTGIEKLYYENGNLEAEVEYKDGIEEGIFKMYYENGTLHVEMFEKNGEIIYVKYYDEKGNLVE